VKKKEVVVSESTRVGTERVVGKKNSDGYGEDHLSKGGADDELLLRGKDRGTKEDGLAM